MQEISKELRAAQHSRQAAEKELLYLKQKAAEVAGKLEMTGELQVHIVADSYSNLCQQVFTSSIAL